MSDHVDIASLLDQPVGRFMVEVLSALAPDTSLAAAAFLLHRGGFTGAPVVDADGRPVGVISAHDLLAPGRRSDRKGSPHFFVMLHGKPEQASEIPEAAGDRRLGVVADVMNTDLIAVGPETPLRDAISLMVHRQVHRVLVVDGERLVGIVTSMDVLRGLVPDRPAGRADAVF